ncbi:LPXTG cell wall anchor domain-containing protein [Corynebacterium sp. CNCTC7651]|uniref:LPXTG cell wall anchor domain-containing protein n=1 Tax=Corynebacterium sp. CNCTC7651 TaxID=2815361 RepID=UPI001F2CD919|nr:LPXTG cell wall anchor domain-containing protein [Corynebacterium sp. CNCTC7651]UIZ92232.1 LPXTG cell wall anchor domain-containing protein [Corynebacterium sp. CNCTC7651]
MSKDGTVQDFTATSDDQAKSVTMANLIIATAPVTTTTSTTSTTRRSTQTTGARFHDATIRVRVVTEGGDPVQDAEVYSVDGLNIQTRGVNYTSGLTNRYGEVDVFIPGNTGNGQKVRLGIRTAPSGYRTVTQQVDRDEDGVTMTLPKAPTTTSSSKSRPQEILEVINEVQPLIAALGGSAAIGAGLRGQPVTTTRSVPAGTSVVLTGTNLAGMSTGRTTSVPQATGSVVVENTRTTTSVSVEVYEELANTGTPMQAVITLGLLSVLVGGAYVAMGRRREA